MGKRKAKKAAKKQAKKKSSGLPSQVAKTVAAAKIAQTFNKRAAGMALARGVSPGGKVKGALGAAKRFLGTPTGKKVIAGAAVVGAGLIGAAVGRRLRADGTPMRSRRSAVPKRVRKWVAKTVSKRKQQDKVLRKLLSTSGASRMMKRSSRGVITAQEAANALRR